MIGFFLVPAVSSAASQQPPKRPEIVASFRPVQALVYAVTGQSALPHAVLPVGVSPHTFTLKPSQAAMLANADIVFWIGPQLETTLQSPLKTLSTNARVVTLIDTPGLDLRHYGRGRDKGTIDPHIWLSPKNDMVLIEAIRRALTRLFPANAKLYAHNAAVAKKRFQSLIEESAKTLAPVKTVPYLVQHDGFSYLSHDFGLKDVGALQTLPGREPGARHIATLHKRIARENIVCLFHEPQFTPALARQLSAETGLRLGALDLMGSNLKMSPELSMRIIRQIVLKMRACLEKTQFDMKR